MAYADYQYYTDVYLGNAVSPEDFPRLAERASEYIDAATQNRAGSASGAALERVKKAVCALVEIIQDETRMSARTYSAERQLTSETVGPWTKSYGSQSATGVETGLIESRKRAVLLTYLAQTGMLRARGYLPCRD